LNCLAGTTSIGTRWKFWFHVYIIMKEHFFSLNKLPYARRVVQFMTQKFPTQKKVILSQIIQLKSLYR